MKNSTNYMDYLYKDIYAPVRFAAATNNMHEISVIDMWLYFTDMDDENVYALSPAGRQITLKRKYFGESWKILDDNEVKGLKRPERTQNDKTK